MSFLLDTHVFIWWVLDHPKLTELMRQAITDRRNHLYLSAASTWEMVIKSRLGKLVLPEPPATFIEAQLRVNAIDPLPITIQHTMEVAALPAIHRDPFDRMLIAQANSDHLVLITDDALIRQYPVKVLA